MKPNIRVNIFQFVCLPGHFWSMLWAKLLGINLEIREQVDVIAITKAVPKDLIESLEIPEGETKHPNLYPIACPNCNARFFMAIKRD